VRRRLIIAAAVLTLLGVAGVLAWELADMPPLGFVLRYGYPSPMGPTGRTMEFEGVEFVEISPGYFRMGSHYFCDEGDVVGRISAAVGLPWGKQPRHRGGECPVHWVEFENGFWIARTEITNEQYERFDPEHERPMYMPADRHPMVDVLWEDAKAHCAWLSERSGLSVRLPSEAEWECACRAGSRMEFSLGDSEKHLSRCGWFDANSNEVAHEVGRRQPNRWGLLDLHGNAWEWCEDTWHDAYEDAPADGSAWTKDGQVWDDRWESQPVSPHVVRGGAFFEAAWACRSANRFLGNPGMPVRGTGFRPAFTLPPEE
jgi:formylglycine-generating enzyme required for sulfatase activity